MLYKGEQHLPGANTAVVLGCKASHVLSKASQCRSLIKNPGLTTVGTAM